MAAVIPPLAAPPNPAPPAPATTPAVVPVATTPAPVVPPAPLATPVPPTTSLAVPILPTIGSTTSSPITLLIPSSPSSILTSSSVRSSSSSSSFSSSSSSSITSSSTISSSSSSISSSSEFTSSSSASSSSSAASASATAASSGEISTLARSLIIAASVVGFIFALILALGFVLRRQRRRRKTSGTLEMDDQFGSKPRDPYEVEDEREKYGVARSGSGYATDEGVFTQAMDRHRRPSDRLGGRSVEDHLATGYYPQEGHPQGMYYGASEVSLFQPPMGIDQGRVWENRPSTPTSSYDYQHGGAYASSSNLHNAMPHQPYATGQHQFEDPYRSYQPSEHQFYPAYQNPNDMTSAPSVVVTAPYEKSSDAQTSNVALMYPQDSDAPAYQESFDRLEHQAGSMKAAMRSAQEENEDETSALQPGGPYSVRGIKMRVIRGFAASLEDELHVVPFTDLTLHQTYDDGWCLASLATGEQGMVPRDCLSLPDVLNGSTPRRTVSPTVLSTNSTPSSPSLGFDSLAHAEPSTSRALPRIPVGESSTWLSKAKTENISPEAPQLADFHFSDRFSLGDVGLKRDSVISDNKGTPSPLSFSAQAARRSSLVDSASARAGHE